MAGIDHMAKEYKDKIYKRPRKVRWLLLELEPELERPPVQVEEHHLVEELQLAEVG